MFRSALYRGHVMHSRRDRHARRVFRYPVFVVSLDLAELPALHRALRLFSYNRPNLFALHDRDYAGAAPAGLAAAHAATLAGAGIAPPDATRLVTNLRLAHYVFNPVSFFLGYQAGDLASVVAEVNNTYGGRSSYVLGPRERVAARTGRVGFRHARDFFVSPFLHGPMTYDFELATPLDGDRLDVRINVRDAADDAVLLAQLAGTRVELSDRALAVNAARYPLMTAQVIGLIHLEALKLRAAGVPYRRPGPDHRPLADP
jgi:DUF1365 family protein